jgi:hypothetical protein
MVPKKLIKNPFYFFVKAIVYVTIFILSWGMRIQYNDITPTTL